MSLGAKVPWDITFSCIPQGRKFGNQKAMSLGAKAPWDITFSCIPQGGKFGYALSVWDTTYSFFCFKFLEDISPFRVATDTPVLDFW